MPNFVITSTSQTAQTLVDGEYGYIARDGELVVAGADAITGSGSIQLAVLGNLTSFGNFEAINFDGIDIDMVIGEAGSVLSLSDVALNLEASTRLEVTNHGAITADGIAISAATSDTGSPIFIVNTGAINGTSAISASSGISSMDISNSGVMLTNGTTINVFSTTGATRIHNSGTIQSNGFTAILGGGGSDSIINSGTIIGTISMNAGNDVYDGIAGYVSGRVDGSAGNDTIFGGVFGETFRGGDDQDLIQAGGGNDTIEGSDFDQADDVFDGGDGIDTLELNQDGSDLTVDLTAGIASGGFIGVDTLISIENVVTGAGNDVLIGNGVDNALNGGIGNDTLAGGDGDDTIRGADGEDRILGETGDDVLAGNNGHDFILGGTGADRMFGGADNDTIAGGDGDDQAYGGSDDDLIYGNNGNDTLNGDDGDDEISGGNGDDLISGGNGEDTLRGANNNDSILGGAEDDVVAGNDGNDTLEGGAGDDRLFGGSGNDIIEGGIGQDLLSGGADQDVFVFRDVADSIHGSLRDTISDFTHNVDRIDLSSIMEGLTFIGGGSYSGTAGEVRYNAGIGRLYLDADGDSISDFSVDVTGAPVIDGGDLIL